MLWLLYSQEISPSTHKKAGPHCQSWHNNGETNSCCCYKVRVPVTASATTILVPMFVVVLLVGCEKQTEAKSPVQTLCYVVPVTNTGHNLVNGERVRIARMVLPGVQLHTRHILLQIVHHIHQIIGSALHDVQVQHYIVCRYMRVVTCDGSRIAQFKILLWKFHFHGYFKTGKFHQIYQY
jgi:hypothetical protein